jgi:hypothetical protein
MKPVLLTVDDDPQVLIAVQRDLGRQYGKRTFDFINSL